MKKRVLIIEDMEQNREILSSMLMDEYDILEADNGKTALEIIEENEDALDAILLDLLMPEMDGYQVLEVLQEKELTQKIAVLVISSESSVASEKRCLDLGAVDFIKKPYTNVLVRRRVRNSTELMAYKNHLEEQVKLQTKEIIAQNEILHKQAEKLRRNNRQIVEILGAVVETRNLESGEHVLRVSGYTRILAEEMMRSYPEYGLDEETIEIISEACILHDVGKIAIPDEVLLKPGRFTPEEFAIMKEHTTSGAELLSKIKTSWSEAYSRIAYEICLCHHERYDGKGYPKGLAGDEIPIAAQLVSLADVYDALINERCYKDAYSKQKAFDMIMNGECGVFSPKILDCFVKTREQFEALA